VSVIETAHCEDCCEKGPASFIITAAVSNSIACYRGNLKINQLLNQEEGCTIEELLLEEEKLVVLCRGGSIPKLIEFICQRQTLQKLIQYSVQNPRNPNNHDQTHK